MENVGNTTEKDETVINETEKNNDEETADQSESIVCLHESGNNNDDEITTDTANGNIENNDHDECTRTPNVSSNEPENIAVSQSTDEPSNSITMTAIDHEAITIAAIALRNTPTPHKLVPGAELGSLLLFTEEEQQLYVKNKRSPECSYWRCRYPNCNERVYVKDADNQCYFSISFSGHKHELAKKTQKIIEIKDVVKTSCREVPAVACGSHVTSVKDVFHSKVSVEE